MKTEYPTAEKLPVGGRGICMGFINDMYRPQLHKVFIRQSNGLVYFPEDTYRIDATYVYYRPLTIEESSKLDGLSAKV